MLKGLLPTLAAGAMLHFRTADAALLCAVASRWFRRHPRAYVQPIPQLQRRQGSGDQRRCYARCVSLLHLLAASLHHSICHHFQNHPLRERFFNSRGPRIFRRISHPRPGHPKWDITGRQLPLLLFAMLVALMIVYQASQEFGSPSHWDREKSGERIRSPRAIEVRPYRSSNAIGKCQLAVAARR